jgi:hypothetical protein
MARNETLVLVFPPLTMPTSPALGSAPFKGFVARRKQPQPVSLEVIAEAAAATGTAMGTATGTCCDSHPHADGEHGTAPVASKPSVVSSLLVRR